MFEQHPVPQQISSYQFRLVGDMTLKQFFQLAAGAVVGLIVYSMPLPGFFKWPMIAIAVIGGAAFAFLPIQDRPLEQWLVAFFRSIYAPTIFVWRKGENPDGYFAKEDQATIPAVNEPLPEVVPHDVPAHNMDTNEQDFLAKVSMMLEGQNQAQSVVSPAATATTQAQPAPTSDTTVPEATATKPELVTPQTIPVVIEKNNTTQANQAETGPGENLITTTPVESTFGATASAQNTTMAKFSQDAAPPSPPSQPNLIVGQVMDANGKIVEGAILEIEDGEGRPVRALKSNRAGHFMTVTPLPNDIYNIRIEKEGLEFEIVSFETTGVIIEPIAIKAKNTLPEPEPTRASWSLDGNNFSS